jgi:DNA helicase-2/ATP-dependent DNA helicase PcrA
VVGDDDQSIYSWRGASYENIINFEKDFPGATEIKLEQNYRSSSTILEAANGVISNNTRRKEKQLWSGTRGGKPVELFRPENEGEEADFIASQIKKIIIQDRLNYDDFGVLLRTNSMTAAIEEAFLAENIPCRVSGGTSFFQRKEIKDILSYLRLIANTNDDVNLLRIINTPRRGIGKTTIAMLMDIAKKNHTTLWDAMERLRYTPDTLFQEAARGKADLDEFMTLIETYREEMLGRRGLAAKVRALVDSIDYRSHLAADHSKNEKIATWKVLNSESLIRSMETWEKDPDNFDPSLYAYLNRISLITRDDDNDEARGKVSLMTIHASKGLEFPVVFIAGAEDGIIPHKRSMEEGDAGPAALEEERRLFYVAITRAREKLFITSCLRRRRLQNDEDCLPSPFLEEIPPHLIEYHEPDKAVESPEEAENYFALIKSKFA